MSARTGPGRPELYPPAPSAHSTDPDSWATPNEDRHGVLRDVCATVQSDQLRTLPASRNCEAVRRHAHCVILSSSRRASSTSSARACGAGPHDERGERRA